MKPGSSHGGLLWGTDTLAQSTQQASSVLGWVMAQKSLAKTLSILYADLGRTWKAWAQVPSKQGVCWVECGMEALHMNVREIMAALW